MSQLIYIQRITSILQWKIWTSRIRPKHHSNKTKISFVNRMLKNKLTNTLLSLSFSLSLSLFLWVPFILHEASFYAPSFSIFFGVLSPTASKMFILSTPTPFFPWWSWTFGASNMVQANHSIINTTVSVKWIQLMQRWLLLY